MGKQHIIHMYLFSNTQSMLINNIKEQEERRRMSFRCFAIKDRHKLSSKSLGRDLMDRMRMYHFRKQFIS